MTVQAIREWLRISPDSPSGLVWAKDKPGGVWAKAGQPALITVDAKGYYVGRVNRVYVKAHRAVFALAHGYLPPMVDHIDGNKSNNLVDNLRAADAHVNQHNQRAAKGYNFDKGTGKWRAQIRCNGTNHYLGVFATEEEAHAAYLNAKKVYHPTAPVNRGDHVNSSRGC